MYRNFVKIKRTKGKSFIINSHIIPKLMCLRNTKDAYFKGGGKAWWLPARNKKERSSLSVNSVKQSYMQLTRVFSDDEAQINKKLPKELLLRIFSYLDVVSLCRCAQVSRAWNVLALDGSNWQRIDLFEFQKDVEGEPRGPIQPASQPVRQPASPPASQQAGQPYYWETAEPNQPQPELCGLLHLRQPREISV
ncbi:uncharacterized protein LOC134537110 isoform X2 [Bacillus rossius redtenbacheri]|uniref:uncharacterized protein LOC134537110 isoform X2 n=1 Tax=Bacillus rossius redtenbacheri TaxID=93214 RepID=UPI002FDD40B1